jgi:hypothetical protein
MWDCFSAESSRFSYSGFFPGPHNLFNNWAARWGGHTVPTSIQYRQHSAHIQDISRDLLSRTDDWSSFLETIIQRHTGRRGEQGYNTPVGAFFRVISRTIHANLISVRVYRTCHTCGIDVLHTVESREFPSQVKGAGFRVPSRRRS